jgi:hypothetical protein
MENEKLKEQKLAEQAKKREESAVDSEMKTSEKENE